jgi:hypothetical protein
MIVESGYAESSQRAIAALLPVLLRLQVIVMAVIRKFNSQLTLS